MMRLPHPGRPEQLRPFLEAQLHWERCHRVRAVLVLLLAVSSAILWLMVARPQLWGGAFRATALAAWVVLSAAAAGAALVERRWYRLRERRLRAVGQEEDAKDA
jgi:membrane protein YdbS with pleckstrin-like domain